jgi:hypothetical protein
VSKAYIIKDNSGTAAGLLLTQMFDWWHHCPKIGRTEGMKQIILVLLLVNVRNATAQSCKSDPKVVASCFTVHGKLYNANGGSVARIWKIGTNRVLGVTRELPTSIEPYMGDFDDVPYADFLVCPYTKEKAGVMQLVCVESATRIVKAKRPRSVAP